MKGALEIAVARDGPLLVLEEPLFHAREIHARLHLIRLFGPVRHVHIAAGDSGRAVSIHVDAIEVNTRTVNRKLRLEARRHRKELLNAHLAPTELRGAAVVRRAADPDVEVRAHHAPRCLVILERELAALRAEAAQRHRERTWLLRPPIVVNETRKVVPPFPPLHQHLPVGHLDRRNREVRLARGGGRPVEPDIDPASGKERPIVGVHAVDRHVLDADFAAEEVDAQRSDVLLARQRITTLSRSSLTSGRTSRSDTGSATRSGIWTVFSPARSIWWSWDVRTTSTRTSRSPRPGPGNTSFAKSRSRRRSPRPTG